MNWYYADGGRQVGPIEESALDTLLAQGVVRDDTLVWREGMANWQPHSTVRGPKPAAQMPAIPTAVAYTGYCSECGRPFPTNQLVMLGSAAVCAQCKPVYLQRVREGGQGIGTRHYAGFWIRVVAMLIDALLLAVVGFFINMPIRMLLGFHIMNTPGMIFPGLFAAFGMIALVNLAISCAYSVYFISQRGATIGMQILGLKVIRADGSQLNPTQALGRFGAYLINSFTFFIGFIIIAFDAEKRALHDYICNTRVIYAR